MPSQSPTRRVGMVLETPFPNDARVEREALALIEAGYEVHLLCGHGDEKPGRPEREVYNGIHVYRADLSQVRMHIRTPFFRFSTRFPFRGAYRNVMRYLTNVEAAWQVVIKDFLAEIQPDILHVHDLRLLQTALSAIPAGQKPRLISDLHENYPALMQHMVSLRKGESKGAKVRRFWENKERTLLPQVDHVFVVVEEAKERLMVQAAVPAEKITVLRNVVDANKFLQASPAPITPEEQGKLSDRFILCYVGHINATHRGIETVLKALPEIKQAIPHVLFAGVGSVRERYFKDYLRPLLNSLGLHDVVHFTGYRSETDFIPYIQQAAIGLCPHTKTELIESTFPNKVFLYNLFEKPVLVNACKPLVRYANETESSLVFAADDPSDLARQIIALYNQPELAQKLGQNGKHWVLNRYNWDEEKKGLLQAYARFDEVKILQ